MSDLVLVPTEYAGGKYFEMPDGPDGIHYSSYITGEVIVAFVNEKGKTLHVVNKLPRYIHIPSSSRDAWSVWYHANVSRFQ